MVRVTTTCSIDLGHCFTHQSSIVSCRQAGVRVGLARNDALKLAAQTVKGAAEMVLSTGSSPAVLKDQGMNNFPSCQNYCLLRVFLKMLSSFTHANHILVCSPGGTTIAGIDELEKG